MRAAAALVLLAAATCAPAPAPPVATGPRLDGDGMLAAVGVLAHDSMEGRGAGTPGGARARRWLRSELRALGLEPVEQAFAIGDAQEGPRAVNLVATIPGQARPGRVLVLGAHYDHLGTRPGGVFNGADDNASGVAAVLGIARWLRENPPASTVVVALFDAEEGGSLGARAFVADPPVPPGAIAAMVNLDMVGRNAAGELWIAGSAHWPRLRGAAEAAAERSRLTVRLGHDRPGRAGEDDWTSASDHEAFHRAGVPFLYFGEEDHADYHRPTDDVERIQPEFLHAAAETVLDALLALDTLSAPTR